jgi:hypothetical protein
MATPDDFSWMMSLTKRNECDMTTPFEKEVLCDLLARNHERCEMMWYEFLLSTPASEFDLFMTPDNQLFTLDCLQSEPSEEHAALATPSRLDNDVWNSVPHSPPPRTQTKKTPGKPQKRKVKQWHSSAWQQDGDSFRKRLFAPREKCKFENACTRRHQSTHNDRFSHD